MRTKFTTLLLASATLLATPAIAADALKFGPPPEWVVSVTVPNPKASVDAPVEVMLDDQQMWLEPGRIARYNQIAFRIVKPEGLPAGNLSISWSGDTDTVTVNKLEISRGGKVIDVLASGQKFTTMRREQNLEQATLDGVLTANIQPEGLQEGDIVVLATTTVHEDPVLKRHVEASFASWNNSKTSLSQARVSWPAGAHIQIKSSGDLPKATPFAAGGARGVAVSSANIEPWIAPKNAPVRFRVGRLGEATDFASWSELSDLLRPLYDQTAVIPANGPLRDEVNRIKAASNDPTVRTEQALQLVQQRVRYVALLMGIGGLTPAPAEQTWSRRFGDCKAKTALLLALLRELGVAAEPVIVNAAAGDMISERLPAVGVFNHVLVRATLAGKSYWLDGTRAGDLHLKDVEVPDFGWGLPLVRNAQLVRIAPPPLSSPLAETMAEIDASKGLYANAPAHIVSTLRGDVGVTVNGLLAGVSEDQRQEFYRGYLQSEFSDVTLQSGRYSFNRDTRELRLEISGTLKPNLSDGYFYVPNTGLGAKPDLDRPAGASHDVPYAVGFPNFVTTSVRLKLPEGFPEQRDLAQTNVDERLSNVELKRSVRFVDNSLLVTTSTRSLAPEVTAAEARASAPRLKAIANEVVALSLPDSYQPSAADLAAMKATPAESNREHEKRGLMYMNAAKYEQAVAEFSAIIAADPSNDWAHANRGISNVWLGNSQAAEPDLLAAAKANPANPVVMRARALQAEFKSDWPTAIRFYTESLASDPRNSFALRRRGDIYVRLKDEAHALADADALIKLDDSSDERLVRANYLLTFNHPDQVAAEASLISSKEPNSVYAQVAAARIYSQIGRRADADRAYARAIAIKPEWYIFVNRAANRPRSDRAGRITDLDRALALAPDELDALLAKADFLSDEGRSKEAVPLYDRSLELSPKNFRIEVLRAIALYRSGQQGTADNVFAALRSRSKSAYDYNTLCWNQAIANIHLDRALGDCEQAVKLEPKSGPSLDSLAFVQLRLGRAQDALVTYGKAIDQYAGASPYYGRALVYERLGDAVHAAADRKEALRLSPSIADEYASYGLPPAAPGGVAQSAIK